MNPSDEPLTYRQLVEQNAAPPSPRTRTQEEDLDSLIENMKEREKRSAGAEGAARPDLVQHLRGVLISELIPLFLKLVEKYSKSGISMQMDASNFLEGGREIRFEFSAGEHRSKLIGTVTSEAIAFHETRYSPDVQGELVSGPMLRLRTLNATAFRNFVCERLAILLRAAVRKS